jgi:hypothetical protein
MARAVDCKVTLDDVDAAYTKAACAIIWDDELPEIEFLAGTARTGGQSFAVYVKIVRGKASRKAPAGPPRARKGNGGSK